ncbi:hypothetical protein ACWGOQ_0009470 [Aquimarina sp. M1]
MITQLTIKKKKVWENKIEITRLKGVNLVNTGIQKNSVRLAKAYSLHL